MNALPAFFVGLSIIVGLALIVTAATAGVWSVQYFARNRRVRLEQRQPLFSYYRHAAFSH
ncbi:hypothetical protein [Luteipulveratus halotolerans]|uniref:Uncharacterized protein n=1 Tax=Luteipulveratus halotolerans TaxID=1631356 RepID=A0A0L6CKP5_9MICO|nr:hypothetical protein [Luteipulveratus halotolerans]KNX38371.1 hypothetical protein VV01_16410 [Luteipulveratus halotolerans]